MRKITEAAWLCGDPGMQFDTTINGWHTCPNTDRINASNPCSEYMFLDDSACNLASLNLMQFRSIDGGFDVEAFRKAVDLTILAQEIMVANAKYPTPQIGKNSEDYRPLGLGYANLGALLMASGVPYDSEQGRAMAAAITALMTGEAYAMSARIAGQIGPFAGYERNRDAVPQRHPQAPGRTSTGSTTRWSSRRCSGPPASPGPTRSTPASRTASATPRSRCWRPPAPSAS